MDLHQQLLGRKLRVQQRAVEMTQDGHANIFPGVAFLSTYRSYRSYRYRIATIEFHRMLYSKHSLYREVPGQPVLLAPGPDVESPEVRGSGRGQRVCRPKRRSMVCVSRWKQICRRFACFKMRPEDDMKVSIVMGVPQ